MDVAAAIGPAFNHMTKLLFKPFKFKLWLALGFVSLLAGSGGGGLHVNVPMGGPDGGKADGFPTEAQISAWFMQHLAYIIGVVVFLVVLGFVMLWVSSVLRMVYMDQIARRSAAIKEPFSRLKKVGTSYFLWQLAFVAVLLAVAIPLFLPVAHKLSMLGPNDFGVIFGMLAYILLIGLIVGIPAAVVGIIANDFVATAMYAKDIKVLEAWKTVIPIIKRNAGQTALYFVMLIAYGIVSGIAGFFVFFLALFALAIPIGLIVLIGYLLFTSLNLSWTPSVIAMTTVLSVVVLFGSGLFLQCVYQPILVFRRAYSMLVLGQADERLITIPSE